MSAALRIPFTYRLALPGVLLGMLNLVNPIEAAPPDGALASLLDSHCYECHDEDSSKGELNLYDLDLVLDSDEQLRLWTLIHDRIESGEMPPEKKPRPEAADIEKALRQLSGDLHSADQERREVIHRRLNRAEYENTIHDLLHIDVDLRESLPEDASVDGFDNIGSALAISTEQMQAYLAAAGLALDAALIDESQERPETQDITKWLAHDERRVEGKLKNGQWARAKDDFIMVYAGNGYVPTDVMQAPEEGWYDIEFICRTHKTEGKPMDLVINVVNNTRRTSRVLGYYRANPENTVIRQRVRLYKYDRLKPLPYALPYLKPTKGYDGPALAVGPMTIKGPLIESWPPPSHVAIVGGLNVSEARAEHARAVMEKFVERAFRRSVTADDVAPFLELVTTRIEAGRPFLDALKVGLRAVLCSPDFLYLTEPMADQITDCELASRLSYFLWSSLPDEKLLASVEDGKLAESVVLRAQTERLLDDPKAARFTENFTGQWLKLRDLDFTAPDRSLYPEFDGHLQSAMLEECHAFFEQILHHDLPVRNFIDSDFAMLNERLARHYGIGGVDHFNVQRVKLPSDSPRGGVLTQGAVLKVTANGTNTSPVLRGIWALDNILGEPSPPPPAGLPAVEPDIRGTTTIREQLDAHRDSESCASCHRKIDPPGFALESFDPIGGFRENYRSMGEGGRIELAINGKQVRYRIGPPVDASGVTPGGDGFQNIHEFKQRLLEDEEVIVRCLAEKLLTYGLGRSLGFSDRPEIERIIAAVAEKKGGLRSLIHEIIQSETFRSP